MEKRKSFRELFEGIEDRYKYLKKLHKIRKERKKINHSSMKQKMNKEDKSNGK